MTRAMTRHTACVLDQRKNNHSSLNLPSLPPSLPLSSPCFLQPYRDFSLGGPRAALLPANDDLYSGAPPPYRPAAASEHVFWVGKGRGRQRGHQCMWSDG
eukprot:9504186-Pyramimonas_sp.AAC.4